MILAAVRDLLFASKLEEAARRLGVPLTFAPRGAPLVAATREQAPRLVLLDLSAAGGLDALRELRADQPGLRVVGFLGHLQTDLRDEARALGAEVLTRGQLVASMERVLEEGR